MNVWFAKQQASSPLADFYVEKTKRKKKTGIVWRLCEHQVTRHSDRRGLAVIPCSNFFFFLLLFKLAAKRIFHNIVARILKL